MDLYLIQQIIYVLFLPIFRLYVSLRVVNKWLVMGELIGLKVAKMFTGCKRYYKCRLKVAELHHEISRKVKKW
jgi:hypothetical protein